MTHASNDSARHLGLDVERDGTGVLVTVTVRNLTDAPLEPGLFGSELLVDDQPWPDWRLALNGTVDERLVLLPPGESAQLSRRLPGPPLSPGPHTLVLRAGGTVSAPARLPG